MPRDFRERRSNLSTRHGVALDDELKDIRSSVQFDVVFLLPHEKAHGVQCHFEFRTDTNETCANKLFNPLPGELECEQIVVVVLTGLAAPAGLDVSAVVEIALLFFEVELDPIVKAGYSGDTGEERRAC